MSGNNADGLRSPQAFAATRHEISSPSSTRGPNSPRMSVPENSAFPKSEGPLGNNNADIESATPRKTSRPGGILSAIHHLGINLRRPNHEPEVSEDPWRRASVAPSSFKRPDGPSRKLSLSSAATVPVNVILQRRPPRRASVIVRNVEGMAPQALTHCVLPRCIHRSDKTAQVSLKASKSFALFWSSFP